MSNNIRLELTIFGDAFDLNELTSLITIKPTKTYLKGEVVKGYNKTIKRKEMSWSYSIPPLDTLYFEEYANKLLDKFESKAASLKGFLLKNNLKMKLFVVLEISGDQTPALYLNNRFLNFINDLEGEIDVDIYAI
ncbi:DUF4279 domain-containing protein [Microscilla marina]|uniref:DUF4279 domain-containing protein n=1 Tax=Microscilla marina ATCC 23134 TaxID=313606 RepID=A1ZFR6_MICM2|nr:DUF4279 domain-containing protein [Microscilla marina]EAY30840.1 conserved hypothetical protein [Microscilla marina ATCC 23134]